METCTNVFWERKVDMEIPVHPCLVNYNLKLPDRIRKCLLYYLRF